MAAVATPLRVKVPLGMPSTNKLAKNYRSHLHIGLTSKQQTLSALNEMRK